MQEGREERWQILSHIVSVPAFRVFLLSLCPSYWVAGVARLRLTHMGVLLGLPPVVLVALEAGLGRFQTRALALDELVVGGA